MTGQLNVLFEKKEVPVLNDKKIISAIAARDERMLAFVVQKYSKILWKIAGSISYNGVAKGNKVIASAECVKDGRSTCCYIIELKDDLDNLLPFHCRLQIYHFQKIS